MMPEKESSNDSLPLGRKLVERLGIASAVENIGPTLQVRGCYEKRDHAIRKVIPEYGPGWKNKIVLPNLIDGSGYAIYSVVAQSRAGESRRMRVTADAYLGIVATTNFKQRVRKCWSTTTLTARGMQWPVPPIA